MICCSVEPVRLITGAGNIPVVAFPVAVTDGSRMYPPLGVVMIPPDIPPVLINPGPVPIRFILDAVTGAPGLPVLATAAIAAARGVAAVPCCRFRSDGLRKIYGWGGIVTGTCTLPVGVGRRKMGLLPAAISWEVSAGSIMGTREGCWGAVGVVTAWWAIRVGVEGCVD